MCEGCAARDRVADMVFKDRVRDRDYGTTAGGGHFAGGEDFRVATADQTEEVEVIACG